MISKELLSEVLGDECESSLEHTCGASEVCVLYVDSGHIWYLNIYELAHKCKEFAFDKGYEIVESHFMIRIKRLSTGETKTYEYTEDEQNEGITFKPEYTFKCCEWILNSTET